MTKLAKKVGGPFPLAIIIAGIGYILGIVTKPIVNIIKTQKKLTTNKIYEVTSSFTSADNITYNVGEKIRILETHKDIILIERIGDSNTPYYVSKDFLQNICDYNE